jgi:hypothetical protein
MMDDHCYDSSDDELPQRKGTQKASTRLDGRTIPPEVLVKRVCRCKSNCFLQFKGMEEDITQTRLALKAMSPADQEVQLAMLFFYLNYPETALRMSYVRALR